MWLGWPRVHSVSVFVAVGIVGQNESESIL